MNEQPPEPIGIHISLLSWFDSHQRDLPWRRTRDPYAIWISEIMLQQTTVESVIPIYERFMELFPTVDVLAVANPTDVLQAWAGLGYYKRARHLHEAAIEIVNRFGSRIPDHLSDLQSLPGIGKYTAGAIASIAFDQCVPVVDTNVARVVSRLFALEGDLKDTALQKQLWEITEDLVPNKRPGDFNQAMMELGAIICSTDSPRCTLCPLAKPCHARVTGEPWRFPSESVTVPLQSREEVGVVMWAGKPYSADSSIFIVQRPPTGLWAGLWEFPHDEQTTDEPHNAAALRIAEATVGPTMQKLTKLVTITYTVMRTRTTLHVFEGMLDSDTSTMQEATSRLWVRLDGLHKHPFSSPQHEIIKTLDKEAALKLAGLVQLDLPFKQCGDQKIDNQSASG